MIKMFGIDEEVYNHIKESYPEMIEKSYDRCSQLVFKRECSLDFSAGIATISMENYGGAMTESFNVMAIDFWRIEIE